MALRWKPSSTATVCRLLLLHTRMHGSSPWSPVATTASTLFTAIAVTVARCCR